MEVRKRRVQGTATNTQPLDTHKTEDKADDKKDHDVAELKGSFWLTRIVFIRSLGFVYCKRLKICITVIRDVN